jgi:hypothetical protein
MSSWAATTAQFERKIEYDFDTISDLQESLSRESETLMTQIVIE